MCNSNYKVEIVSIESTNADGITAIQKKINQWITTGILAKYEIHTTSTHVIFNICCKKSEPKPEPKPKSEPKPTAKVTEEAPF